MIWEFLIAALVIELTPGPNMTWLAVLGATQGRNKALAAVAGICIGLGIAAAVAGLGLTALLYEFPQLFAALRWAGTLYLLYLAWEAWSETDGRGPADGSSLSRAFYHGLVSNALNPKAYLFYAAILPHFIMPDQQANRQIMILSGLYVIVATVIHTAIAAASGSLADWLAHSPQAVLMRRFLALLIAGAAIWFFYSTGEMK